MHNNLIMDAILWSTHMIKLFFHLYLTLKFEHKDGLGPLEQSRKMKKKKIGIYVDQAVYGARLPQVKELINIPYSARDCSSSWRFPYPSCQST